MRKKQLLLADGAVAVLILAIVIVLATRNEPSQNAKDEAKSSDVVTRVSELFVAPNETPTVAVIQNKENITDNKEFFRNAQNGDYMLVYRKAGIAVIYREGINKIVNAGDVLNNSAPSGQAAPQE